jgi:hypothetical protein
MHREHHRCGPVVVVAQQGCVWGGAVVAAVKVWQQEGSSRPAGGGRCCCCSSSSDASELCGCGVVCVVWQGSRCWAVHAYWAVHAHMYSRAAKYSGRSGGWHDHSGLLVLRCAGCTSALLAAWLHRSCLLTLLLVWQYRGGSRLAAVLLAAAGCCIHLMQWSHNSGTTGPRLSHQAGCCLCHTYAPS